MALNPAPNRVTRRAFVRAAMGSVGMLAAGGATVLGPARRVAAAKPPGNATRYPLYIPPQVGPSGLTLTAAPATVDLGGGQLASVLAYNGQFPGPTIVADITNGPVAASITLQNGLSEDTMIHWHGMPVPTAQIDGNPRYPVLPGGNFQYQFPITRSGMMWYHPHPHGMTGEQIYKGLAGAFIVRGPEEAALNPPLPSGNYEVPLILRDITLDHNGNPVYNGKSSGVEGQTPLVNGTSNPFLNVDTTVYRFRVLCATNARIFRLALDNGTPSPTPFTIIGNDGGLLSTAVQLAQIDVAPAERLDLLVDFSGLPVGAKVMLRDVNTGWGLLEFRVTQAVSSGGSIPPGTTLTQIPALQAPPEPTRVISFDGMSRIEGQVYDLYGALFTVLNPTQTELWRFTTGGNAPHPVHVHRGSFQIKARSGGRGMVFPWEGGWKDTVLLLDGETVDVAIGFGYTGGDPPDQGGPGLSVFHCHKLEHEDNGMMANFVAG